MKIGVFFLVIFLFSARVSAYQISDTAINKQAKKIVFQQSIDRAVSPDFYNNKILILDFWATWCAPCIAGFPHFNELSKKYGNDQVVFASITNEPLPIVQRFFNRTKKELSAIKLIDTSKATMNSYQAFSIPYCVIIDKKNMLRWAGITSDLTGKIIRDIINNDQVVLTQRETIQPVKATNKPNAVRPFFTFNIAISDTGKLSSERFESHRSFYDNVYELSCQNNPLLDLLETITKFSRAQIVTNDTVKLNQHIDLNYKVGFDTTRFRSYANTILPNAPIKNFVTGLLGEALKFRVQTTIKNVTHYELIVTDLDKLHSFISMQSNHSSFSDDVPPRFEIVHYNLKDITTHLENSLNKVITTNITDTNKYDLSLDITDIQTLNKSLQFHGLRVVQVTNEVQFFNINFY